MNSKPQEHTEQLIALAIGSNGDLSPHAGRATHWVVYALATPASIPVRIWELQLTDTGCLHEWHVRGDGNRHPLHSVDIAIAGSAGDGVIRRLAERDTTLVTTAEKDPMKALTGFITGTLPASLRHDETECLDPSHHQARSGAEH